MLSRGLSVIAVAAAIGIAASLFGGRDGVPSQPDDLEAPLSSASEKDASLFATAHAPAPTHEVEAAGSLVSAPASAKPALEQRPLPAIRRSDYYPTASFAAELGFVGDDPRAEWLHRWHADKRSEERDLLEECDEGRDPSRARQRWNEDSERRRQELVAQFGDVVAAKILERYPLFRFQGRDMSRWVRIGARGQVLPFVGADQDRTFPPLRDR